MKTVIKTIETDSVVGQYGGLRTRAILEHSMHGRLFITQGFCGQDSLAGGAIRWRGGVVATVLPADTLATLSERDADGFCDIDAVLAGADARRPLLFWSGDAIAAVARRAGL